MTGEQGPNNMYPNADVDHRVLDLVAFQRQGKLCFMRGQEYKDLPRKGAPKWAGFMAIGVDSNSTSLLPGMWEGLMVGEGYAEARRRVLAEGWRKGEMPESAQIMVNQLNLAPCPELQG